MVRMSKTISQNMEDALKDGRDVSAELHDLMQKARKASDFLKACAHENRHAAAAKSLLTGKVYRSRIERCIWSVSGLTR